MKAKNVAMVSAILAMAMLIFACAGGEDPNAPDLTPKPKSVKVEYSRVLPVINPNGMDDASLNWLIDPHAYAKHMTKVSENNFIANGVVIETEKRISIQVIDPQMWNGVTATVCKTLKIDGQELVVNYIYGRVEFKYGNDGTIRVYQ